MPCNCHSNVLSAIAKVILFGFCLTQDLGAQPEILWHNTFGGDNLDCAYTVMETDGGHFVLAGVENSSTENRADFWLFKTDCNGNLIWETSFGGAEDEYAYSACKTTEGGYALTGFTESYGAGGRDIWIVKTDVEGNPIWDKTLGLAGWDEGRSVRQTEDGGFILTGSINSYLTESVDLILARYDMDGNLLWTKFWGDTGSDTGLSVQQTNDGGFIVAGITSSYGAGSEDLYLIKTDPYGNTEWEQVLGGTQSDWGRSVQQTSGNDYVIAGYTNSVVPGNRQVWLTKVDNEGEVVWSRTFGGTQRDEGTHVEETYEGGFIVSGSTCSYGSGSSDLWLLKTDADGLLQWDLAFGGSGWDRCHFVQQTSDGGYITTGDTRSFGSGSSDAVLLKVAPETGISARETSNSLVLHVYPNPCNSLLSAVFFLPEMNHASLNVYDLSGRQISTVEAREFPAGFNTADWNVPSELNSGCYLVQLTTCNDVCSRRCIIMH